MSEKKKEFLDQLKKMQQMKTKYDQLKVDMASMQEKYDSLADYGDNYQQYASDQALKVRSQIDEVLELNYDDIRKNQLKSEQEYLKVLKQKLIPRINKHPEDTLRKYVATQEHRITNLQSEILTLKTRLKR